MLILILTLITNKNVLYSDNKLRNPAEFEPIQTNQFQLLKNHGSQEKSIQI